MTLKDKSPVSEGNTPLCKLSKIAEEVSISVEKNFQPYWTRQCAEMSSHLWLPTRTSLQDLELTSSESLLKTALEQSWFSIRLHPAPVGSPSIIFAPSSTLFPQDATVSGITRIKSKKIRIFPDAAQRKILRKWFAGSRRAYNATIAYLEQPDTIASWLKIKKGILDSLPDWCQDVPFQIKSIAVKDACLAVQNAKRKYHETGAIHKCSFRSIKNPQQTMYIPKKAVTPKGVYHTLLGILLASEPISTDTDCRLTMANGRYFLVVGEKVQVSEAGKTCRVVALDPGVRSFLTFYSVDSCGKIGLQNFGRILELGRHLDDLISRRTKEASKRSRRNMKKAEKRLRWKIRNLIDELHFKAAKFLLDNFDVIIIPKFETSQMAIKSKRKLRKKSVRAMMTYAHYRFQEYLKFKASLLGKVVINQCEAYTSKTASWTGEVKNNNGAKYIVSGGQKVDRDYNGARGIFLRALCEIPPLSEMTVHE